MGPKPIMEHILDWLKANDVKDVVIATGYLGRMIEQYFGDGRDFGMRIEYARSDRPMGHAGQLKSAEAPPAGDLRLPLRGRDPRL